MSYEALARGHPVGEETCEVPGLGPVPVSLARMLTQDAVLKVVVTKGADVAAVASQRRSIPAAVRTALAARDRACVVPGCTVTHRLQAHHWRVDFARGGLTELKNLARLCVPHHNLITYGGWLLTGGPGRWELQPP